jgi:hypothetical protein
MKNIIDLAFKWLNVQTDLFINFWELHYAVLLDYTVLNKASIAL